MKLRWPALVIATLSICSGLQPAAFSQAVKGNVLSIPITMNSSESITLTTTSTSLVVPPDGTYSSQPIAFSTAYNLGIGSGSGRSISGAAYFSSGTALAAGSVIVSTAQINEESTTSHLTGGSAGAGPCTTNNSWFSANTCPMIFAQQFTGPATGTENSTVALAYTGTIPPAAGSYTGTIFISVVAN